VITGSVYLDRGQPVTVLAAWNGKYTDLPAQTILRGRVARSGPHNVLVRDAEGRETIRPFRGLLVPGGAS